MLKAMALTLLRKIAANLVEAKFFCIMCDEYTDAANREQLVVFIRWVDYALETHEEMVGVYKLDNIEVNTIVSAHTRWTVRAASFKSVLDNYSVLQKLWEESKDQASDPSIKARIIGVEAQFKTFRAYFEIQLGHLLLQHSDNLSKSLETDMLYAAACQKIAAMTVTTLEKVNLLICFGRKLTRFASS